MAMCCTEESGETFSTESNGVAEWLCPLCQKGQPNRSCLSLHLTEQHSVLPSCVDNLLDIAVIKQGSSRGEGNKSDLKSSGAESSQLKPLKSAQIPANLVRVQTPPRRLETKRWRKRNNGTGGRRR
ncbi:Zinc finger homeobox protein 2 [Dissostichus eleginoides]|uniref:Zinc finger homeobox protein 2 n=1 Tax=Dissostichus eleginoides TaxID=100907 RepID=A0AAD9BNZ6_DISEL|nr:Zinc finger homeobox protein 2 [Dissostichus eleginoides]